MTILDLSQVLGNLGEFVGAIGVVGTLIYLGKHLIEELAGDQSRK